MIAAADLARCLPILRAEAYRLTQHACDADDLVQDTIEAALRRREPPLAVDLLKWLWVVMKRVHIDNWRKTSVRPQGNMTIDTLLNVPVAPCVYAKLNLRDAQRAIGALPIRQQTQLIAYAQHEPDVAARLMGVAVPSLRSQVCRARAALKEVLA